jgi:Ca2+-binding EF-hand superfamily protein
MKKFNANHDLKRASYSFMAAQLMAKEEREKLSSVFRHFDKNDDGKISK